MDTLKDRLEAHEIAVRSGIPAKSSIEMLDLPIAEYPGWEVPMISANLVPLEQVQAEPEPVPTALADFAVVDDNPRPDNPTKPPAKKPEPEQKATA